MTIPEFPGRIKLENVRLLCLRQKDSLTGLQRDQGLTRDVIDAVLGGVETDMHAKHYDSALSVLISLRKILRDPENPVSI